MSLRDALRKAASLVVQIEPPPDEPATTAANDMLSNYQIGDPLPPGTATVADIAQSQPGPNLDEIQLPPGFSGATPDPSPNAASVDFPAIYSAANLPDTPFTAEQTLEMIAGLPPNMPLETKRQSVRAMLGSMGKSLGTSAESIVADASRKLAALGAYAHSTEEATRGLTDLTQKEIADLEGQIEEKRKTIQDALVRNETVHKACDAEAHRIDDLLEFFSLDLSPSSYASAPSAPSSSPEGDPA